MNSVTTPTPPQYAPPFGHDAVDARPRFEIRPGAFVVGFDGALGRVRQVIVSPGNGELRGLVVRTGTVLHRDVLVPIDVVVDANDEVVKVDLAEVDLSSLPRFEEGEFVKAPAGWRDPGGRKQPGALFHVPTDSGVSGLQPATAEHPGAVVAGKSLKEGQKVVSRDGDVGRVDLLLVDPQTKRTTHFVVRRGLLLSRDIVVPIDWVRDIEDDRVLLDVGGEQLERLSEYRPDDDITADIADALWNEDRLPPEEVDNITFRVKDGLVELRGVTTTEAAKSRIEQVVMSMAGVRGVRNLSKSLEVLAAESIKRGDDEAPVAVDASLEQEETTLNQPQSDYLQPFPDSFSSGGIQDRIEEDMQFGYVWLHELIERAAGLDLDERQVAEVTRLAERKLFDLFDVAEETAAANGRTRILRHDLPLTKGLRRSLEDASQLANGIDAGAILTFLTRSGVRARVDEGVRSDIPRLMAALLVLSSRIIALLEPANVSPQERIERLTRTKHGRPTKWEIDRASRVVDLTL